MKRWRMYLQMPSWLLRSWEKKCWNSRTKLLPRTQRARLICSLAFIYLFVFVYKYRHEAIFLFCSLNAWALSVRARAVLVFLRKDVYAEVSKGINDLNYVILWKDIYIYFIFVPCVLDKKCLFIYIICVSIHCLTGTSRRSSFGQGFNSQLHYCHCWDGWTCEWEGRIIQGYFESPWHRIDFDSSMLLTHACSNYRVLIGWFTFVAA